MKKGASQIQSHSGNPTNQPVRPQPLRRGFPEVPSSNSNGLPTAPASRRYASILFLCHSFPCLFNLVSPANSNPFQPIPTLKKTFFAATSRPPPRPVSFSNGFPRSAFRVPRLTQNYQTNPFLKIHNSFPTIHLRKNPRFATPKTNPFFPATSDEDGYFPRSANPIQSFPPGDTTRLPSPAWTPTCPARHLRRRKLGCDGGRRIASDHGARVHDRGLWPVCPRIGVIPPRFCALASLALGHR